jgi:hypothetical protein
MANFSGEDTRLQIGRETTWGTGVAPTAEIDMISEEFGEEMTMATEPSLVGKATEGRSDIMGKKVPGGFTMLVKPDNIGLVLACALGSETGAGSLVGSGVYDHTFSLITGSATMLPKFTAVVNKKAGVFGYVSNKIKTLAFEMANNDYLKAKVTTMGRQEQADGLETLTLSSLRAFNFNDLLVEIDDVAMGEVVSCSITVENGLEDDLFVADGSEYMIEIDRQRRVVTVEMEVLYSAAINTLRTDKYKAGADVKLELIFTGDVAAGAYSYSLKFELLNAYITACKPVIGGPERMRLPMTFKAAAIGSDQPLTAVLRNMISTAYLS